MLVLSKDQSRVDSIRRSEGGRGGRVGIARQNLTAATGIGFFVPVSDRYL
jgi:hypothetical protein